MAFSKPASQPAQSPLGTGLSLPTGLSSKPDKRDLEKNTTSIQLPVTGFLMKALKILFKFFFLKTRQCDCKKVPLYPIYFCIFASTPHAGTKIHT